MTAAEQDAIAEFIRNRGVTRCPVACSAQPRRPMPTGLGCASTRRI